MPTRKPPFSIADVRCVGIVGRYNTPTIAQPLKRLASFLSGRGVDVLIEADTSSLIRLRAYRAATIDELGERADLVIVVGGDGTMLSVSRQLAVHGVPLIGINQGRLGFLTDIALADMESQLGAMFDGRLTVEERPLLRAQVIRGDQTLNSGLAFNEIVVNRGGYGGMIDLSVAIGDSYVCDLRCDGVIVATPTGSTAYSMSANGPIVHPSVSAWSLVPISPHALTNRPIVVGDSERVVVTLTRGRDAAIHWDGQSHHTLTEGDSVCIDGASCSVRLVHPHGYDYYAMLRQKLHWSESPLVGSGRQSRAPARRS